jgi:hypothetical protein
MRRPKPQSVAAWIVSIAGLEARFSKVSGIEATRTVTEYNDGFSSSPRKYVSPVKFSEVTLEKPYELDKDEAFILAMTANWSGDVENGFNIVLTPVDGDNKEVAGKTITLNNALPVSFSLTDIDRNGDGVQFLILKFAPQSISV